MLFIILGLCILASIAIAIRRQSTSRTLAPRPVVIRTTPRRRR